MVFTKKILLFVLLLLLFSCGNVDSKKQERKTSKQQIKLLMNKALDHFDVGEYEQTEELFNQLDTLISQKSDTVIQIQHLFNKSELLKTKANYSKSITNYYKALRLAQEIKDVRLIGKAYYNISTVYLFANKVKKAHYFNQKAIQQFKLIKNEKELINSYVLSASINRFNKDYDLAHQYLDKVIRYALKSKNNDLLSIAYNNKANIYTTTKNFKEGIDLYNRALKISKELGDQNSVAIYWGNIGKNYLELNALDIAEVYIDSSLELAIQLDLKETKLINYERLVDLEKKKNNFQKALEYSEKMIRLKTEIDEIQSRDYLDQAKKQFQSELKMLQSQNKIKLVNKDKLITQNSLNNTRIILYFVVLLIFLSILIGIVLYRKRQEILVAKNKLHESEKKRLADELEFKRKELLAFSLGLSEKEKFIQEMKEQINKLSSNKHSNELDMSSLRSLLLTFHADGDAELHAKIEKVNSSFHFNLKTNFPFLTEEDIRLASLIVLGTSSKDIASILSIEVKSVNMKRYRLKKKLNLEHDADLNSFLKKV